MKRAKILALALVASISLGVFSPAAVKAKADDTSKVITNSINENANDKLYQKQKNEINNAYSKILPDANLKFNPSTIYDMDTIGARVQLLAQCGKAITFATTDLSNKVQKAHTEIGFAITRAVIMAANPFESVESIEREAQALEALMQALEQYPELSPTDVATIYYKKKLDSAIWEVRFKRDRNILGKKSFKTYNELNRNITKAVGVQLRPSSTCIDIDNAIIELNNAYAIAEQGK